MVWEKWVAPCRKEVEAATRIVPGRASVAKAAKKAAAIIITPRQPAVTRVDRVAINPIMAVKPARAAKVGMQAKREATPRADREAIQRATATRGIPARPEAATKAERGGIKKVEGS